MNGHVFVSFSGVCDMDLKVECVASDAVDWNHCDAGQILVVVDN